MNDATIAAISTPQGEGGIGIIRISGEDSTAVADRIFESVNGKKLSEMKGYRAAFGKIVSDNEILDEVVCLVYRAPHSYTGEDTVEICCHGGIYVTRQILRAVLSCGASLAEAGEFSKRAFINGKMDLCKAQAVMDIISAKSRQAVRAAAGVLSGKLSQRLFEIKDRLLTLTAHLCAWADYPEEDIPQLEENTVKDTLKDIKSELQDILLSYEKGRAVTKGIDTVIVGKPNVGKSTLMNLLSGYDKSIVTDIPGTTRDVVEESVIIGDITLRLADTAGIRETDNPVEQIGVLRAKEKLESSSLVLAVFDGSEEFSENDRELLGSLEGIPTIAIINKGDLEQKLSTEEIENKVTKTVYLSAKSGNGLKAFEDTLIEVLGTEGFDPSQGVITSERQRNSVEKAISSVEEAENALMLGFSFDAVTVCVEETLEELNTLTGENASEEIIERVFHNFCLGK